MNKIIFTLTIASFMSIMLGCTNSPKPISSIEDAKKYAHGVWVYCAPLEHPYNRGIGMGVEWWYKLIIKENKTYEIYRALPVDDNWGKIIDTGTWDVESRKYSNTGTRYYALYFKTKEGSESFPTKSILKDSETMSLYIGLLGFAGGALELSKGDIFPFSK